MSLSHPMTDQARQSNSYLSAVFADLLAFKEKYRDQVIVIKFGGALAEDPDTVREIAQQATFLAYNINARVVLVHGGGRQIDQALETAGIAIRRDPATGLRITDPATLQVTDTTLRGMNENIAEAVTGVCRDVRGLPLAGYSNRLIRAQAIPGLERTGEVIGVDAEFLQTLIGRNHDTIPVIYPICFDAGAQGDRLPYLNVNADDVAVALAVALNARRLILCSDIQGVLGKDGQLLTGLSERDCEALIADGTVTGGMIPKLRGAAEAALKLPGGGVVILDGSKKSTILQELLYSEGAGTLVRSHARMVSLGLRPKDGGGEAATPQT